MTTPEPQPASSNPGTPGNDAAALTSHRTEENTPEPQEVTDSEPQKSASPATSTPAIEWQAIWSPQYNAYYFYNSVTQQTTWQNPLQPPESDTAAASEPPASEASVASTSSSSIYDLQAAAAAKGIDPSLAHLDPSLVAGTSSSPGEFTYAAKFNARTGAFTRPDGRDPTHLSEYERARRMSEFYFDVNAWEKEVEARKAEEAEGKKRKKPTKKDLERFKEQKRLKKVAKTAWLRT